MKKEPKKVKPEVKKVVSTDCGEKPAPPKGEPGDYECKDGRWVWIPNIGG